MKSGIFKVQKSSAPNYFKRLKHYLLSRVACAIYPIWNLKCG
jgi:hypothetical protein